MISLQDDSATSKPTSASSLGPDHDSVLASRLLQTRRKSEEANNPAVLRPIPVHKEYLIASSTLFRQLLSPSLPPTPQTASKSSTFCPPPFSPANSAVPTARIIHPSISPRHTTVFLPLPDPTSFGLALHYMYHGQRDVVLNALTLGLQSDASSRRSGVDYKGFFKNMAYLGLDTRLKVACRDWYKKWIGQPMLPSSTSIPPSPSHPHPPETPISPYFTSSTSFGSTAILSVLNGLHPQPRSLPASPLSPPATAGAAEVGPGYFEHQQMMRGKQRRRGYSLGRPVAGRDGGCEVDLASSSSEHGESSEDDVDDMRRDLNRHWNRT